MKRVFLCAVVFVLIQAAPVLAQAPDFSGTWKLDPARSRVDAASLAGLIQSGAPQTLHIAQPANGTLIVESQINESHSRIYKPGARITSPLWGGTITMSTRWESGTIVSEGTQDSASSPSKAVKEILALSADGQTLTIDVTTAGPADAKSVSSFVYTRTQTVPPCQGWPAPCKSFGPPPAKLVQVVIETDFGAIEADIDMEHAPVTATNFLRYVDEKFYEGGRFHRTVKMDNQPDNNVKIEVVQAAVNPTRARQGYPAIPLERTSKTGLLHKDGTLSMARGGPDSATSSFFICIGDQPSLDFAGNRNADGQGFAAFGKVTKGMDVVRKIQQAPAEAQNLKPTINISNIHRK